MSSEPIQNAAVGQTAEDLMALPAGIRAIAVFASLSFRASLFALRDTILSKVGAWTFSKIGLFGYYVPSGIIFIAIHVCLFLFGQSSWHTTTTTLRRLASRDDADDDLITQLFIDATGLVSYLFVSLLLRNIVTIWGLSLRIISVLSPLLLFLGVVGPMWFFMVDNPISTFAIQMAKILGFVWPKMLFCLQKLWFLAATVVRHCLQWFINLNTFMVSYRDNKTATTAATLETYKYSTLGSGEIRLLKLSNFTPWGSIRCELIPTQLTTAPPFETISYSWGMQKSGKSLIINGKQFRVSERVYDIVHSRTSCLMTRFIWIDSICINQADDEEKSYQVQLMRNIYGSSYHTVVWLGHAPDPNEAMGFLAHLRRRIDFDDPVERASRPLMERNIENPGWAALNRLVKQEYWARCWVIQEIAVSKKVIISYGGELITWDFFSSIIQIIFSGDPNSVWHISKIYWRSPDPPPMDAGIQIATLGRLRETILANQTMTLFDALIASINSTATDARDNIFAVQGISTAAQSGDIIPDYTSTANDAFLETGKYLLKQEYPSRVLHLAGIGFHRSSELQTSWIPDWSSKRLARMYWRYPSESPYSASGAVDKEIDMSLSSDGCTLTLKGIIVDRVKLLGPQFFGVSQDGVPKADVSGMFKDYAQSRNLALYGSLKGPYITGVSRTDAFWRTLVGDRTPEGTQPADPVFFSYYQALEHFLNALSELSGPDMNPTKPRVGEEEQARLGSIITNYVTDMGMFANMSGPHTRERMFAITERGYMGVIPPYAKVGDTVAILRGAQVPFLLRQGGRDDDSEGTSRGKWQLVGESYFHGMMNGEMVRESHLEQTIHIC